MDKLMEYSVYADFSRPLTSEERAIVFAALDANVLDSGCVGIQNGPNDEIHFCIEASTDTEAQARAIECTTIVLRAAKLNAANIRAMQICRSHSAVNWQVPDIALHLNTTTS